MPERFSFKTTATAWFAALATILVAGCSATSDDYAPAQCAASVPYRGAPLHDAVVVPTPGALVAAKFDPATVARLDQAIESARRATGAPSLSAAVAVPERAIWTNEAYDTARTQAPLHYWASVGKTFLAVAILQLVEEQKLSLDDPVERWVPGVPNGNVVTVRNLLEHTSGLFSANEDLRLRRENRSTTAMERLEIAARHGAMFCPGELWRYSNTGYDVLGAILERIDGRSYPEAITARIIRPLGLTRLRVLQPNEAADGVVPLASSTGAPIDPSWPGAAGAIVGTAEDMIRFWRALLSNQLLKPDTTRLMFERLYPMFDKGTFYGLGVMFFDLPDRDDSKLVWLGHQGGAPGAGALVVYSPRDDAFAAVALTGDGPAPAAVNLLLHHLRTSSKGTASDADAAR